MVAVACRAAKRKARRAFFVVEVKFKTNTAKTHSTLTSKKSLIYGNQPFEKIPDSIEI